MDQPEAMQEDRGNWNQEEMLEAAVGLINLDSVASAIFRVRMYPHK